MTDPDFEQDMDDGGETGDRLYVATFASDGAAAGVAELPVERLSDDWLTLADGLFEAQGATFDVALQGPLSHLRIKWTSASGAALGIVFVDGTPAASAAVASGLVQAADRQVLTLFAQSIAESAARLHPEAPPGFADVPDLAERPLLVIVPWPGDDVADHDRDVVAELLWHLAAAFIAAIED